MNADIGRLSQVAESNLELWWVPTDGSAPIRGSRGLLRRLGFPDGLGEPAPGWFLEQIHPQDRDAVLAGLAAATPGGPPIMVECRTHGAAGDEVLRLRGAYYTLYGMEQAYLVGSVDFVTGERSREAALAASERRLRLTVEAAQLGLWDWDIASDRIEWSDRVYEILGVPRQTTPTFPYFLGLLHSDDREAVVSAVMAAVEGRASDYAVDFRVCSPGRESTWLHARGDVVRDADGRATHMVGCILDVSDRKAVEQAALQRAEEADAATRAKDAFLAAVSHEVRTPMTAILGFAELLLLRAPDDEQREYARTIERSARRLKRMLDDVLDQARINADAVTLHLAPAMISDILARVEPVARIMADTHDLDFRVRLSIDCAVAVDLDRAEQILLNLVSNAVKFTSRGGVEIQAAVADGFAHLSVRDSGMGIDPAFLPFIFEPFRQESTGHRRRLGGTGLGLSIAQGLARRMGGIIEAESSPGVGSTFTLRLPCINLATPPAKDTSVRASAGNDAGSARPRILILDDEEMIRNLMRRILEESADVAVAASPDEAFAAAAAGDFDLFVFDFALRTSQTGADVLAELRKYPRHATTPAICVTANYDADNPTFLLINGFSEVLTKPFSPDDLREAVDRHTLRR